MIDAAHKALGGDRRIVSVREMANQLEIGYSNWLQYQGEQQYERYRAMLTDEQLRQMARPLFEICVTRYPYDCYSWELDDDPEISAWSLAFLWSMMDRRERLEYTLDELQQWLDGHRPRKEYLLRQARLF